MTGSFSSSSSSASGAVPTPQEAFAKLSALCARAEHSSGEMRQRMRRWQMDDEAQQAVLDALAEAHFVDDSRYARMYVDDKLRFNRWGPRKIQQGLMLKGVSADVAQQALDGGPDGAFDEVLRPLLKAKARQLRARSAYELRCKLVQYAAGRGFAPGAALRCMDMDEADTDCARMDEADM